MLIIVIRSTGANMKKEMLTIPLSFVIILLDSIITLLIIPAELAGDPASPQISYLFLSYSGLGYNFLSKLATLISPLLILIIMGINMQGNKSVILKILAFFSLGVLIAYLIPLELISFAFLESQGATDVAVVPILLFGFHLTQIVLFILIVLLLWKTKKLE